MKQFFRTEVLQYNLNDISGQLFLTVYIEKLDDATWVIVIIVDTVPAVGSVLVTDLEGVNPCPSIPYSRMSKFDVTNVTVTRVTGF